ncbi:hypothetical protein [Aurantiacibacter gangjinensis]|uniref:Uncharacterized protein n=1 Tax=Aurantiacibacter gangjinensis TaxID=502682 RepID=A0A0G9MRE4_9SPHN|nr:hypothetical protein [Aurantiacibacter gangjinensis]APE29229.1 hypothetical protein BMF35_a2400 [Aurantiacibacter gangjinensis]KLE33285.1 hypothetical protein AAW01_04870 [Aurantiacibacter gangjinensis]
MSHYVGQLHGRSVGSQQIFNARSRSWFEASYPEGPHKLEHNLHAHPLLELEALAQLAQTLPAESVQVSPATPGHARRAGSTANIAETVRMIADAESWVALRNIEQDASYAALLQELLGELSEVIAAATGRIVTPTGAIFIASPDAVTRDFADSHHAMLLQLHGAMALEVTPPVDAERRGDAAERFAFTMQPGEAMFVPALAPHRAANGHGASVALAIAWQSAWSIEQGDARAFNAVMRKLGLTLRTPRRWPARHRVKALGGRMARALGLTA